MAEPRRLLAVFAHPDDESFGSGGALADCAASHGQATLVCATRGEVGQISDPGLATPETLGQVREAELRCACRALGLTDLIFLDYRDSGMAGTPENDHPRAFCQADAAEVVARLVGIIRRVRPQIVVTFDPNGGYGHPDHLASHRHTVAAFHAAGDAAQFPDQGPAWQPARLFYAIIAEATVQAIGDRLKAAGIDTSQFEQFRERRILWPPEQIQVEMDVSAYAEAKWRAFACHRTQFGPDHPFLRLPKEALLSVMSREYFALAWPEPAPGLRLKDLFDGLTQNTGPVSNSL